MTWREEDVHTGPRGLRLRCCVWGRPEPGRPPVLVLHGLMEQAAAWDAVATALDRHVVAPDQRGHGLSDHVGAGGFYHFWDYVADADGVVARLGGAVDLVGHSMGGTVATLLAGTRPDIVRRLVVIEGLGPPDGSGDGPARPARFLLAMREPPAHPSVASVEQAVERMRRFVPSLEPEVARRLAERTTRAIRPGDAVRDRQGPDDLTWTWDPLHRGRAPVPYLEAMHLPILAAIRAPTVHVVGSASPYTRIAGLDRREAAIDRVRRVTLEGVGHHPHHQCPTELAAVIRDHLES